MALREALVSAGFVVERWWPVFAEMESGTHLNGKQGAAGHLDIVFVCGRPSEVTSAVEQDSLVLMGDRLAEAGLRLVAADHRALLKAKEVQQSTWAAVDRQGSAPAQAVAARPL